MLVQIFTTENTENTEEKKRFLKKMITNHFAFLSVPSVFSVVKLP
jgi:hypothetical protein